MAEFTANAIQTIASNQNVLFTDTAVPGNCSIMHRSGSGLFILRGLANGQCRSRFKVGFSGNIAISTGGTAEAISVAISIDGEAIASSTMISTPPAALEYNNISTMINVDVPTGSSLTISIKNTSSQSINIQNANVTIERVV